MRVQVSVSKKFHEKMEEFCTRVEREYGIKKYSKRKFTEDLADIIGMIDVQVTKKNIKGRKTRKDTRIILKNE